MVSSGMTILRALFVLEEQTEVDEAARQVIIAVRKDVEAGLAFSAALARHPKVFGPLFVSMVRAGEIGGVLEDSLDPRRRPAREGGRAAPPGALGDGLPGASSSRSRSVVMIVLVVFIVPVFAGVLKQFATTPGGASLPG